MGVNGVLSTASEGLGAVVFELLRGFEAAAVVIVLSFATAPAYLKFLRQRDANGVDTSGLALQIAALSIALVVFVAVAFLLTTPIMG